MSPELAVLRVSLMDLRANLEAKFRVLVALDACAGREPDAETLCGMECHIVSLQTLHQVSGDMIAASDGALRRLVASSPGSPSLASPQS